MIIFFAAFFLVLDSYLKSNYAKSETLPNDNSTVSNSTLLSNKSQYLNTTLTSTTATSNFSLRNIYWVILVPLFLILITIFIWCFYFRFIRAFLSRRKLIYIEVLAYTENNILTRKEAKASLNLLLETTTGLRVYNFMYDKYWFQQREHKLKNARIKGYSPAIYQTIINSH